ncbi:L-rhamnose-H(+) transport protein [Anaerohalosphaera lusitana]|uniref:L-rhamnose-H(+) transport protein n=1 Tax=Anaerohalosphaera lusitana TaxID=1936003 RepID=A0A1U9NN10_9BACT|nr:L-rhamnose/proton symporter RhaT [Anaerohalosphaera lusitana]AQT69187.1 L-rhamnose-H(+) transport protein [Anaerohalosphaera lusitana]
MIPANPIAGGTFHGTGAMLAANCYAPQKFIRRWSWETFWIVQASFCWLILPVVGAYLTIPKLGTVLGEAIESHRLPLLLSFGFSLAYGVGGIAFNYSIRYMGFALTYAVAIGLSSVLGTIVPPLVRGQLIDTLTNPGAMWVIAGIGAGTLGIACCGYAGRLKERGLVEREGGKGEFSLTRGLLLSLLAGVLSAFYAFAIEAAAPVIELAAAHGAGHWQGNVAYLTANTGAFVTSAVYALMLARKNRSLGEFVTLPQGKGKASLLVNYMLAALVGTLWYGQFFFYNLGHVRMGQYAFTSWAVHMTMLVLFSSLTGLLFREWKGCSRRTVVWIILGVTILLSSVMMLTYGNYIGSEAIQ